MKLLRDCAVLALLAGAVFLYKHRPAEPLKPTFAGPRPNLAMPAPGRGLRPAPTESAMLVTPESSDDAPPRLNGQPPRPRPLGQTPQLFDRPQPDAPAAQPSAALAAERPSWVDRLGQPGGLVAIAAAFLVCWALLTRALRRGPGGRGFTHD